MTNLTDATPSRITVRRTVAVVLVAAGCVGSTVSVLVSLRAFVLSAPENFDPTALYVALLLSTGAILVLHCAAARPDQNANAGWLLAIAIVAGAPALVFTVATLGIPFLFALEKDGWTALVFVLALPVTAGPALGVGSSAVYLLCSDEMSQRRRVISVALIFFVTAAVQAALLFVTRNGLPFQW